MTWTVSLLWLKSFGLTTSETKPKTIQKDVIHNPTVNTKKESSSRENNMDETEVYQVSQNTNEI